MSSRSLTRREFVELGAATGVGAALGPALLGSCPSELLPDYGVPFAPSTEQALVAAARGRDLGALTHEGLDRLSGVSGVVKPGETVFIKPNFLTAGLPRSDHTATGEITKPQIVIAAAKACLAAGAAQVIIGDGGQVYEFDREELRTLDGASPMATEAGRVRRWRRAVERPRKSAVAGCEPKMIKIFNFA